MTIGINTEIPSTVAVVGIKTISPWISMGISITDYAKLLEIDVNGFYETNADGEQVLNEERLSAAITEAEKNKEKQNVEEATQTDTFVRSQSEAEVRIEETASKKEDLIEKEYKDSFIKYYNSLNTSSDANQTAKDAAEAWEDAEKLHFVLTKTGVTNATIIAKAAECISKFKEAVDLTKDSWVEEIDTEEPNNFFIESTDNDGASNYFSNNPFFDSAMGTSETEEELVA